MQDDEKKGLMDAVEVEAPEKEITSEEADESIPHVAGAEESGEEAALERPDYIPEKFWSDTDGPDIENLAKSYKELESKFRAGKHKAPDEYDLTDLKLKPDDPVVASYTEWAKENGVSQEAFETLANKIIEISGGVAEQQEFDQKAELEKLGPNATDIIKSNKNWQQGLKHKGIFSDADMEELHAWGFTADGQKLIQKMRNLMGEKVTVPLSVPEAMGDTTLEDLYGLVRDPRYKEEPAFRKDVERKFEQFHSGAR
jgi:hypothetical protein